MESEKYLVRRNNAVTTAVFAHRGWHVGHRENTLEAFRAAVELGVQGVELDVRRAGDGSLVVHHDPAIGDRPIATTPRAELAPYVASLGEALEALGGVTVNVEIKNSRDPGEVAYDESGGLARDVVATIRSSRCSSVLVSSFDRATCEAVRRADAEIAVAWLIDYSPRPATLERALRQAHERGFDALNPNYRMLDARSRQHAAERGLALYVWTVNGRSALTKMFDLGVEGIITDASDVALAIARERRSGTSSP